MRALRRRASRHQATSYSDILAGIDAGEARALGEQYLQRTRIHRKRGAPLFIDKMPNNFAHIGLIRLALPNAKIIDAPASARLLPVGLSSISPAAGDFSYSLDDIGRYYRDYVELMAHFDEALPGRVHRVIYGHGRRHRGRGAAPARVLRPAVRRGRLRFFENPRAVRTASSSRCASRSTAMASITGAATRQTEPLKQALGPVLDAYPQAPHPLAT